MRSARLSFLRRTTALSSISPRHSSRFVPEFRLGGPVLQNYNKRQNSTKAGIQPSDNRWIADDDEIPTITWPESISWSQPMKGPGCARGEMSNTADEIQKQLHADGHRVWGFVMYHCTYGDDAAWQTFLERIHAPIRRRMEYYHGLDLLEEYCFKLTVLEDASKFYGASVQLVREHFREWRKHAVKEDQDTGEEIEARRVKPEPTHHPLVPNHEYGRSFAAVRYRFCVQIDEAALQSIVSPEGEECYGNAWVNLVEADRGLEAGVAELEEAREQAWIDHTDMGGTLEDFNFEEYSEVFPEVNGCIVKNVGFMKVQCNALIPEFYSYLQDPSILELTYYRPPEIAGKS